MIWQEFIQRQDAIEIIDEHVQEFPWTREWKPERIFNQLIHLAYTKNVHISDIENADYETDLHRIRECTEKGLS